MKRNSALDFFKGIGIFLVVAMHASPLWNFPAANFTLNTIMRFAVPLFFLISGYLLFSKIQNKDDFGKRILKYTLNILRYYVMATAVIVGLELFFFKDDILPIIKELPLKSWIYYGIETWDTFHLWYLIANFWAGLIVWFMCRKNLNNIKNLLIFATVLHIIGMFIGNQPLNFGSDYFMYQREALFFGLFYLSLGCYLGLKPEVLDKLFRKGSSVKLILIFSLAQLLERALIVFGRFDFGTEFDISQNYWGEFFFFTIPLTLAIFKYALDNGDKFKKNFFTKAGQESLLIYIVHVPFFSVFWVLSEKSEIIQKLMPLMFLMSFMLSFGVALFVSRIKRFFRERLKKREVELV